ncbi:MAG: Nif3-like dinuclear metal center hexameric protein [Clostridiales bacterium]|nr:Nif3-like dinuclear metal center hexameric protein [Clostridiales bacterium]
MTILQMYELFNRLIPQALSASWDNDGLMCCSDPHREVKRVLCTLDVTGRVVDYAIENGFDMIISHHPLIFKPISQMNPFDITAGKLIRLMQNDIAVLSFHTRLDAVQGGVNDRLASILGIINPLPFGVENEMIGRIGEISTQMSLYDFATLVKERLGSPSVLLADSGKSVSRVALLGGDGKDFIMAAVAAGADTFVTGRASYNTMIEAPEIGINIIEAGHFYTEDIICRYFAEIVWEADPSIETAYLSSNEIVLI